MWRRWVLVWMLSSIFVGCSAQAPIPVALLPTYDGREVTVAGAVVIEDDRAWLVAHVVTMPDVPVQLADERYPIEMTWIQQQWLPWRDDGEVQYVPAIVTGEFRDGMLSGISRLDTDMREQTVVNHDSYRLIRLVGNLHTHPDGMYIHDQYQPDQSRGFWPTWSSTDAPIRLAEGAEILIEGVRVDARIIPVVVAPVIEKSRER